MHAVVIYFRWRHAVQPSPYTYTHAYANSGARKEERGWDEEKDESGEGTRGRDIGMDKKTSNKE